MAEQRTKAWPMADENLTNSVSCMLCRKTMLTFASFRFLISFSKLVSTSNLRRVLTKVYMVILVPYGR